MSYPNRDVFLSKNEQENIRKMLGPVKNVSEYLGKAAKYLKEGKDLAKSLAESAPWLKDVAEAAGAATPIVGVAVKLAEKWLEQTHPYELGAVACTLAYQDAAREAVEQVWTSAVGHQDAMKIDDRLAERIRGLPPAEEADLSSFSRDASLQHAFVRRADEILGELTRAAGLDEEQRVKVFNITHERFVRKLDLLLSDKKTAPKFAPFKEWIEMDGGRQAALAALQIHAKYQRDQYLSEPLFKREPYALQHIYVSTECGKLTWGEIRGPRDARRGEDFMRPAERRDPFSENHGGRHDLLDTATGFITDRNFKEPIVIQGVAGAGKSSFTLRLCAELWEKGFHPLRIRLKRLRLSSSLIDALNDAVELADEDHVADLPSVPPYVAVENPDEWRVPHRHTLDKAFSKYEETFDASLPKYDEDGKIKEPGRTPKSNNLEVLGLPLLAYLTIRVMAQTVRSGGALEKQQAVINEMVENPTLLYRSLIDLTCEKAGKAAFDVRDRGDEVERQWREVGRALRERLRRTAAAMSTLGVEHISREEWKRRALQDEREDREAQTAEDHPLTRLMISFYFKGGQPEQGCEFAHKSFREYLFAECVVETLKECGRRLTEREAERAPSRDYWRDFSREENRPLYYFSRDLAYLLAPQWVAPNVWDHLQHLIEWEITRAAPASNASPDDTRLTGLPTQALSFERWKYVRDGLADLWEWWCDCAHMRPQVRTDRWKKSVIEPPFVEELIRWAAPLTAEENESLPLESPTSLDAHLGDTLCQICAMVHFYIAVNEGLKQIEPGTLEYLKSGRKCQRVAKRDQIELVLFAPGGEDAKPSHRNPKFKHYCARINSAFDSPLREFPSRASLDGVCLDRAALSLSTIIDARLTFANLCRANLEGSNLNGASLNGADLIGANLALANLNGASLNGANLNSASLNGAGLRGAALNGAILRAAVGLTHWQIESAWIDERTKLPDELEKIKPEILERQRLRWEEFKEISTPSLAREVVAPETEEEE